jgi:DNA-binding transcriptional ArsR family regulator
VGNTPRFRRVPLAAVIGQTRASLLAHLDLPMMTTQLAAHLGISAPSVNAHLQALRAAGIVSARRDGRSVLYTRTALADRLLRSVRPAGSPPAS